MAEKTAVAPGAQTSEHGLAKIVVIISSIVAVLGTLQQFVDAISPVFANVPKLGSVVVIGSTVVGAFTAAAYGLQRTLIKIAAINAGSVPPANDSPAAADVAAADLAKAA